MKASEPQTNGQKAPPPPRFEVPFPMGARRLRAEAVLAIWAVVLLRAMRWVGIIALCYFGSQQPAIGEMIGKILSHLRCDFVLRSKRAELSFKG